MYQKIFVPVDNSEPSFTALREACKIAQACGAQLRIANVVNMNQPGWGNSDFLQDSELQQLADKESEVLFQAKQIAQSFKVASECKVLRNRVDPIAVTLAEEAKAWGADLIVMHTHGWGGIKRLLLGSVSEGLLRNTAIPILLLRSGTLQAGDPA